MPKTEALRPNLVLRHAREAHGWSLRSTAARLRSKAAEIGVPLPGEVDSILSRVKRIEGGRTARPRAEYRRALAALFEIPEDTLFGPADSDIPVGAVVSVTSHKFVPAYVGADALPAVIAGYGLRPDPTEPGRYAGRIPGPAAGVAADLYAWPTGVVICHLQDLLTFPSLVHLAQWRERTYREVNSWMVDQLQAKLGPVPESCAAAVYVLSAYWLHAGPWAGDVLDRAVRVTAMPRVLLDRDADGTEVIGRGMATELALLRDGLDRDDLVGFGSPGASIGYATWSGVAYHPRVPGLALTPRAMIDAELATQHAWCYAHGLVERVAGGDDPVIPDGYGQRYLRRLRAQLSVAGPREDGQTRSMRAAIVATSHVTAQLDAAIDALGD